MAEMNRETENLENKLLDKNMAASMSRQGITMGRCLQDALKSLQPSPKRENGTKNPAPSKMVEVDSVFIERVMKRFGEAAAETQIGDPSRKPPKALLRGRLDHYNRIGQNWRISVNNARIKETALLPRKRKSRDGNSLWEIEGGGDEIALVTKVQILAFNDT